MTPDAATGRQSEHILVPCFACGCWLDRVNGAEMQPYGGVYCETSGNFGSRLIDGERVAFVICDGCMDDGLLRTRLVKETRIVNTSYAHWPAATEVPSRGR